MEIGVEWGKIKNYLPNREPVVGGGVECLGEDVDEDEEEEGEGSSPCPDVGVVGPRTKAPTCPDLSPISHRLHVLPPALKSSVVNRRTLYSLSTQAATKSDH